MVRKSRMASADNPHGVQRPVGRAVIELGVANGWLRRQGVPRQRFKEPTPTGGATAFADHVDFVDQPSRPEDDVRAEAVAAYGPPRDPRG